LHNTWQQLAISAFTCGGQSTGSRCRSIHWRNVVLRIGHIVALGLHVQHGQRWIHLAHLWLGAFHVLRTPSERVHEHAVDEETVFRLFNLDKTVKLIKISKYVSVYEWNWFSPECPRRGSGRTRVTWAPRCTTPGRESSSWRGIRTRARRWADRIYARELGVCRSRSPVGRRCPAARRIWASRSWSIAI
jgi:hypothetical protein